MPLLKVWLGRFVVLIFVCISIFAQSSPRIPKVLYSCDTAGVLGCFPLLRSGDKAYVLGNVSKASLTGEEATITVAQYDAVEMVISYKDPDKAAILSGRLSGNRIQGSVVSSANTGEKIVRVNGKWTALVVPEAADFNQIASRLPAVMNVCQTNDDDSGSAKEDCFVWPWDAKSPVFAGNLVTVERFDGGGVVITGMNQHGTGGLAGYVGKMDGDRIVGTVDYFSSDGQTWKGKWTASFAPRANK